MRAATLLFPYLLLSSICTQLRQVDSRQDCNLSADTAELWSKCANGCHDECRSVYLEKWASCIEPATGTAHMESLARLAEACKILLKDVKSSTRTASPMSSQNATSCQLGDRAPSPTAGKDHSCTCNIRESEKDEERLGETLRSAVKKCTTARCNETFGESERPRDWKNLIWDQNVKGWSVLKSHCGFIADCCKEKTLFPKNGKLAFLVLYMLLAIGGLALSFVRRQKPPVSARSLTINAVGLLLSCILLILLYTAGGELYTLSAKAWEPMMFLILFYPTYFGVYGFRAFHLMYLFKWNQAKGDGGKFTNYHKYRFVLGRKMFFAVMLFIAFIGSICLVILMATYPENFAPDKSNAEIERCKWYKFDKELVDDLKNASVGKISWPPGKKEDDGYYVVSTDCVPGQILHPNLLGCITATYAVEISMLLYALWRLRKMRDANLLMPELVCVSLTLFAMSISSFVMNQISVRRYMLANNIDWLDFFFIAFMVYSNFAASIAMPLYYSYVWEKKKEMQACEGAKNRPQRGSQEVESFRKPFSFDDAPDSSNPAQHHIRVEMTLDFVLWNDKAYDQLKEFTKREFTVENVLFLKDVADLMDKVDMLKNKDQQLHSSTLHRAATLMEAANEDGIETQIIEDTRTIIAKYVKTNAELEVNLPHEVRANLLKDYAEHEPILLDKDNDKAGKSATKTNDSAVSMPISPKKKDSTFSPKKKDSTFSNLATFPRRPFSIEFTEIEPEPPAATMMDPAKFEVAAVEIFSLVRRDTWPRFTRSSYFAGAKNIFSQELIAARQSKQMERLGLEAC